MKINNKDSNKSLPRTAKPLGKDFVEHLWEKSWTYIKTVVDIIREPVLVLDKDLRIMAANKPFYQTFQVEPNDTEGKVVYELGNGQWNIPALRKLLEDILPKNTFFKGFEVAHEFPFVGRKIMILNARQIHFKEDTTAELFPPIILLAMEDVTEIMLVAETLASRANQPTARAAERLHSQEVRIGKLENEINELKKSSTEKNIKKI